ncbi:MAG: universal stress protein [Candidatus Promineifilaceae bacterium]
MSRMICGSRFRETSWHEGCPKEESRRMTTFLYATRGGASAYLNQDWAVALAKDRGADLLLLYVSNVHFLDQIAGPINLDLVEAELEDLGEFLLAMAQERAEKSGLEAKTAVRSGEFVTALEEIIKEEDISVVVLGCPTNDTGITSEAYINGVAETLQARLNVEVYVIGEGRVVNHLFPTTGAGETNEASS